MTKFSIKKESVSYVRQFKLSGRKIQFTINEPGKNEEDLVKWFKTGVEEIVNYATKDLHPTDRVGFSFCSDKFKKGPGYMKFKMAANIKMDDVWDMIVNIFQSNSEGLSSDTFCLEVTSVRVPKGKGRKKLYNNFNEECAIRKGIVVIKNHDNLCLPRALIVAMAHANKDPDYRKVRRDIGKVQTERTRNLLEKSKIKIPDSGAGLEEVQLFQQYLNEYQIIIYKYNCKGRTILYAGPEAEKTLHLLYHEHHFNVVISLTAAFCCNYYCTVCHIPYDHKNNHRCAVSCPCCQQTPACPKDKEILCLLCNRSFRGSDCLDKHRRFKICDTVKRCSQCLKTIKTGRKHFCEEIYCKICQKHQAPPHYCYIQPNKKNPKIDNFLFIFYDLETRQEEEDCNRKVHLPNLCVFQHRCHRCLDKGDEDLIICSECGVRRQILQNNTKDIIIEGFVQHMLEMRKKFKRVVVLAHNGQAFDHQFILHYLLTNTNIQPELIMRGTKIILMQVDNIHCLDSLNYFPMPLSALPQAFGLLSSIKKGYFPHLFNKVKNQNYVGPVPDVEYYDPDGMKPTARENFLKWYNERKNYVFDFNKELVEYCISDVQILTEACLKFRRLLLEHCNVCPFTEATTIASACNLVYRRNFLEPNTIGIIPKNGYRLVDNQSAIAIKWLIWMEDQHKINILHAAKGPEVTLHGVKVDGYCAETKQVFEFHGCYYHGHPTCLRHNRNKPLYDDPSDTLESRFERTEAKITRLRNFGYEVIEKWECEFLRELQNSETDYLHSHPMLTNLPLNPRDAFYGGRTGNTRTYYKCKEGEKIKYIDICSLYPWVCKYGKFPIGHPTVYIGHETCSKLDLSKTHGIIKCTILPPNDLYHPVLPIKLNQKNMFVLCRTCGEKLNQGKCNHPEDARALQGTWVIDEVYKAIEKGYKILNIYEIWSYDISQYDKLTRTGGLFTEMMNKFLQMKQQASGWPSHCVNLAEKEKYIEEFLNNEGVQLQFEEIVKNPGLRSIAKLILNSFWGKFGQRENQPKTSIINSPAQLFEMLSNPAVDVIHILPINENVLVVNWEYKDEAANCLPTVNVCIAAYTTAQARLKLYAYLEKLDDRVLYYDTDSVIYISREGEWEPSTGDFVGDMTDELADFGVGTYIEEFVCGGPKSYAYRVHPPPKDRPAVVCKVKGINLNFRNLQHINIDVMKNLILNNSDRDKFICVTNTQFNRTENHQVITVFQDKVYRPTAVKRKFFKDCNSYPYGHKKICK